MGLFKSLGTKLKRAVSIKNLTNLATGNFSGVGQELIRVASTKGLQKRLVQSNELVTPNVQISQPVEDLLNFQGAKFSNKVASKVAGVPGVQNFSDMMTKTYIQSMWFKYKTFIIGLAVAIICFLLAKKFLFGRGKMKGVRTR